MRATEKTELIRCTAAKGLPADSSAVACSANADLSAVARSAKA
jgi:hypothetical protein